jgi:hypothetical protein
LLRSLRARRFISSNLKKRKGPFSSTVIIRKPDWSGFQITRMCPRVKWWIFKPWLDFRSAWTIAKRFVCNEYYRCFF